MTIYKFWDKQRVIGAVLKARMSPVCQNFFFLPVGNAFPIENLDCSPTITKKQKVVTSIGFAVQLETPCIMVSPLLLAL